MKLGITQYPSAASLSISAAFIVVDAANNDVFLAAFGGIIIFVDRLRPMEEEDELDVALKAVPNECTSQQHRQKQPMKNKHAVVVVTEDFIFIILTADDDDDGSSLPLQQFKNPIYILNMNVFQCV
mmetsp:Transcript_28946/g.45008  ORF Transcript_28946/g.45008 Transcript_28946/m.45008 type:complete len:126 (-) Transcript_28946:66-443(-)